MYATRTVDREYLYGGPLVYHHTNICVQTWRLISDEVSLLLTYNQHGTRRKVNDPFRCASEQEMP